MSEWQPISTAPKDGTPVLGYAENKMTVVYWERLLNEWYLVESGAYAADATWWPTHWMPLPAPPQPPPTRNY